MRTCHFGRMSELFWLFLLFQDAKSLKPSYRRSKLSETCVSDLGSKGDGEREYMEVIVDAWLYLVALGSTWCDVV